MPYRLALIAAASIAAPIFQASQAQRPATPAANPTTKAEFAARIDARFSALDTNNDGRLNTAEIAAAQSQILQQRAGTQQKRVETRFEQLDTNNDKQLSLAEFRAIVPPVRARQTAAQQLSAMDSDKDGFVSTQEFRAAPLDRFDNVDANDDGVITAAERRPARRQRR